MKLSPPSFGFWFWNEKRKTIDVSKLLTKIYAIMRKISIRDLEAGSKFTKSLYLDKDTVFVGADQPITQQDLDRLVQFGITFILTDGEKVTADQADKSSNAGGPGYFDTNLPFYQDDENSTRYKYLLEKPILPKLNLMRFSKIVLTWCKKRINQHLRVVIRRSENFEKLQNESLTIPKPTHKFRFYFYPIPIPVIIYTLIFVMRHFFL